MAHYIRQTEMDGPTERFLISMGDPFCEMSVAQADERRDAFTAAMNAAHVRDIVRHGERRA